MTRIWFDPLTPKQALFCNKIGEQLETADFDILYTTRRYSEVTEKLNMLEISAKVIGEHGGANLYDKLLASAERVVALTKYVNMINADIAFSFASPEGARVAFGLGIPYFTANDSPHSRFVAQLTIPFAHTLFTPWIMEKAWLELGIPQQKITTYKALDPIAWLDNFTPNPQTLTALGIERDSEFVVIRPEEAQAAYLHKQADETDSVTNPVIEAVTSEHPDLPVIVLGRYPNQRKALLERFGAKIILPDTVIDATTLLFSASLLVGAGGTMSQEASLLGVPVISCFPGDPLITDQYLEQKQLLYCLTDPQEAAKKALEILSNKKEYKSAHHRRAQKLRHKMENPAKIIASQIQAYTNEK